MRNLWEVMTDIVPVKRVFDARVCVCVEKVGGKMEREVEEVENEEYAYVWSNTCG